MLHRGRTVLATAVVLAFMVFVSAAASQSRRGPAEDAAAAGAPLDPPKVILAGATPSVGWLVRNLAADQGLPFDGFVFRFTERPSYMLGDRRWSASDVALEELDGVPWGRYERFVQLQVAGPWTFDWRDDAAWSRTIANMRLLSTAIERAGATGVFLEPRFRFDGSHASPWDYSRPRVGGMRFRDLREVVAERGEELIQALQSSAPDLVVLSRYLASVPAESTSSGRIHKRDVDPLLVPFVEGMLRGAGPGVTLIDSADRNVLEDTRGYPRSHHLVDVVGRSVVDESLHDAYAQKVRAGVGVYFDTVAGVDAAGRRRSEAYGARWLRHSIYNAALTADDYMWVLARRADMWSGARVPSGAAGAIRSAYAAAAAGDPLGFDIVKDAPADRSTSGYVAEAPEVRVAVDGQAAVARTDGDVTAVEFIVDGLARARATERPFRFDLGALGDGDHELLARAYTAEGAHTSSNVLRVGVRKPKPSPTPSPSPAPSTSPSPTPTVSPTATPRPTPSPTPAPSPPSGAEPPFTPTPEPNDDTGGVSPKELRFSIRCDPVVENGRARRERIDPLVSPGAQSAHVHTFFGARFVTPMRDVRATRQSGTTCEFSGDTGAYWVPVLYDRGNQIVDPVHVLVYYRHSTNRAGGVDPHPQDTGIITAEHEWLCSESGMTSGPPNCSNVRGTNPNGAGLRYNFKPQKLPNGQWTPAVAFNIRYGRDDLTGVHFGRNADGSVVTPHADFWNTWHQTAFTTLVNRCLDPAGVWQTYTDREWTDRCNKVTDNDFMRGD